jgi:hypothetical protein
MPAPGGAPTRENDSDWDGTSLSVAEAVNVYGTSSGMVTAARTPETTGVAFTSVICSVTVDEAESGGEPLSVTRTVML